MKCKTIVFVPFFLMLIFPNPAVIAHGPEEEALEKTASELYGQIMCPLCAGQTIGQSTSETSKQMRNLVLKKLRQGETKEEILKYFTSRYGERILAKPIKKGLNLTLWFLPFVLLALTGIVIYLLIRLWARKAQVETAPHFKEADIAKYKERVEKELKEFDDGF
jgi:cytochrome c-type biogenesis protein CcmH